MPTRDDLAWFKQTFDEPISAAISDTPFSLDLLTAIAAQETGQIWGPPRKTLQVSELLQICVGDVLDADKGRSAFPKTRADLIAAPQGDAMFAVAREALVGMAAHVSGYAASAKNPNKFCHAFGIFQYDLQFFRTEPDYFLQRRWHQFDACLAHCLQELRAATKRIGLGQQTTLTDLDQIHVAIAYNSGTFRPSKGLRQGYFDGTMFYGERIRDFLRLAQTVPTTTATAPVSPVPPGVAPIAPPAGVAATGDELEVDVKDAPLRLRREPRIDPKSPGANVIAHLPDGQRVRRVTATAVGNFVEVETSLHGGLFHGFADARFLIPALGAAPVAAAPPITATPPANGIVAVFAPRAAGSITRRTGAAGAQSLNEANQPTRTGTTPAELRTELAAIIDYLAVDKPAHTRYQPRAGVTFCNIYAHDYCALAGAYLPRVWWTPDAIERLSQGIAVEPRLGSTIDEQRANDLFRWLNAFGLRFGWRRAGALTELQTEVNVGGIGLIVARRKLEGRSGHIVVVVPEDADEHARRDSTGDVVAPLQSQAGTRNFQYGTGAANWWNGDQFAESAFWLHG